MSGFTFGSTGAGDAGKQLPTGFPVMTPSTQAKPAGLFGTGLPSTAPQSTGFTFGTPTISVAPTATFGTPQTSAISFGTTTTPSSGMTFGTPGPAVSTGFGVPSTATTGFTLGSIASTTAAPTTGLTFGTPKTGATTSFTLGGGENVASTAPPLSFGTPSTASTGFGLGGATTSAPVAAAPTTTTATSFSLGNTIGAGFGATATTTTPSFSLSAPSTTSATTSFSFGSGTSVASTTGFAGLGKSTSAAVTSNITTTTTASLGTTTTVSSASSTQAGSINFCQLEELINKWTLELEEQEKVFVNQATQVNAWDKLLITNEEKIASLNQEVEMVKIEQQKLEHELNYVVGQQNELKDCLEPLEKELASLPVSDPEREYTYRLAENLDRQLKKMSEDLKEIIEHLNEANRTQDSGDPIVQIGKVLNAHMNSLQWLDQRTALLSQKIQQIDQMHQNFRQEHELSFSLAYN